MTYLQNKKLTFMSIVNRIKGFVRSVSGIPPLILPDCVDEKSLINYTIEGNSVQNGTPTPDAPVEVESVGEYDEETGKYKIPVVCSGKNLFDKDKFKYSMHMCTVTRNDYNYTIKGSKGSPNAASSGSFQIILPKSVISQTNTFTVSINITMLEYGDINNQIRLWTINNSTAKQNMISQTFSLNERCRLSWTFTNADYELTGIWFYVNGNKISFEMDTLQIETNDVMTDYEPYYLPVTTNIYLDEPLRKVREYGDYLDFDKCTHIKNIGYVKNPIIQQVMSAESLQTRFLLNSTLTGTNILNSSVQMTHGINRGYANDSQPFTVQAANNRLYYYILNTLTGISSEDSNTVRVEKASAWLSGKDVEVVYIFKKPIETPITIPKLPTFRGTTIYTIKTSVQPSDMSATYYATSKE